MAKKASKKLIEKAKPQAKKGAGKKKVAPKKSKEPSLGRPLVTNEEKLYMLFHEDYEARQVFEFLRVETVKDLEQFSPEQIVRLLSKPIRTTVDHIRQRLAEKNRHLLGDIEFAAEWKWGRSPRE
ncbi:MAG: hypothetical protein ACKVP0_00800 [Pirellulaceae bacterium]